MNGYDLSALGRGKIALLCCLGAITVIVVQSTRDVRGYFSDGIHDFTGLYVGSLLVGTPQLYDIAANMKTQERLVTEPRASLIYVRLPYFAEVLRPLTALPYTTAVLVWKTLLVTASFVFLFVFPFAPMRLRLLAICCSLPLSEAVLIGQDSPFVVVWIALALRLYQNQRHFLAGCVLALVAEKWHFFVFLPLLFIAGRYWTILSGAVAAGLLILASCFLIQPGFLNEYYRALTMPKENMNAIPWAMPNIAGVFWFLKRPELACAVLALPVAWMLWRVCRRWSFEIGLSACILGGLVVAAHGYIHDWTIALPALLTLYVSAPATRLVTLLMGAPVLGSLLLLSFTTIGMTWLADILTVGLSMIALSELLRSDANLQTGHPVQDTSQSVEAPARSGGDNAHQRFACA